LLGGCWEVVGSRLKVEEEKEEEDAADLGAVVFPVDASLAASRV